MITEDMKDLTPEEAVVVIDTISEIDKVFSAILWFLEGIYETEDPDVITVYWECLMKLGTENPDFEFMVEGVIDGDSKYEVVRDKLTNLGLM